MKDSDAHKLEVELLQKDLETYRKLETWSASLFLGALALTGKQLFEWDATTKIQLAWFVFATPAVIGMVAFVFLRVVNHRMHRTQNKLWGLTRNTTGKTWGILGIIMALMPLGLGLFISLLLVQGGEETRRSIVCPIWVAGLLLFVAAAVIHVRIRFFGKDSSLEPNC